MIRVEESEDEVRLIQPGGERVDTRIGLLTGSVLVGAPASGALFYAWYGLVSITGWSVCLSLISAQMFWKAEHLSDLVCRIGFDHKSQALKLSGGVIADLDEVRTVRFTTHSGFYHELRIVVQRHRGFYDVHLCTMKGQPSDRATFEQAAASIAQRLGARVEIR